MLPTPDQALQFCIMLQAGLPADDAILYFVEPADPRELSELLRKWTHSKEVKRAQLQLLGKAWQDLSLNERIQKGLDQQYAGMAYMCFTVHYATAAPNEKAKLDTARMALEAKLAGTAGKTDALSRFFEDIQAGRVKLNRTAEPRLN